MKHKVIILIASTLVFLTALGITLYPLASNYVNQKYASIIYTEYEEVIQNTDDSSIADARRLAEQYNKSLAPVSAYEKDNLLEAAQDYSALLDLAGNGIMGYVEIPSIQINLPIFHGTDAETLERGIGHLLGSSLPIGGIGTHTVLSGHSGLAGQKMFTDLLQVKEGDVFYLHVLDETLAYKVIRVSTVLPYDTSLLGIVPDADLCTLITCTPLAVNTHRLLVRGHCIGTGEPQHIHVTAEAFQIDPTITASVMGIILLIMLLIRVLIRTRKKGQEGKHLKCNQVFLHLKRGDLIGNNKKTK